MKKIYKLYNYLIFGLMLITPIISYAVDIKNPLNVDNPQDLVGVIIKSILGLVGVIALVYFIMGGFMWMTAGGNADKIKNGKDTLVWAVIGLIVIFASYSLVNFFLTDVVNAVQ